MICLFVCFVRRRFLWQAFSAEPRSLAQEIALYDPRIIQILPIIFINSNKNGIEWNNNNNVSTASCSHGCSRNNCSHGCPASSSNGSANDPCHGSATEYSSKQKNNNLNINNNKNKNVKFSCTSECKYNINKIAESAEHDRLHLNIFDMITKTNNPGEVSVRFQEHVATLRASFAKQWVLRFVLV